MPNDILHLINDKGFYYDAESKTWYDNRRKCQRDDVLIFLIRVLKADGIQNAGEQAAEILISAEKAPELSFYHFKKGNLVREYGARVKGRDVFMRWLECCNSSLMDEIRDMSEEEVVIWLRRHCMLLNQFYKAAERAGIRIKSIARIGVKGIFRHVFVGWKLVTHRKPRIMLSVSPVHNPLSNPLDDAVLRYNAFMRRLFEER